MAKSKIPLVAICGRPNVGKSTLFNRITGKQRAIIHGEEGITRDRTYGKAMWNDKVFRVVDTGGIVENPVDPITEQMQQQVRQALDEAAVVLFVVDAQQPITRVDEQLRDELYKLRKPVVLAANKLDNAHMEANRYDFYELGVGEPYAISSGHGIGMDDLMKAVTEHIPAVDPSTLEEEVEDDSRTRIAIVGKPNVGKSSFVNALLNEQRVIVTDIPGTTRDAVDIEFKWKDKDYLLIDTAGLRRKGRIDLEVERFSVSRSLRAINRADVVFLMVDAIEGISEQDKRIVSYVTERGVGLVLIWTKWDLIDEKEDKYKALADEIELKIPFLKYVPYVTISNISRQRIFKTLEFADQVKEAAEKRIPTAELNRFLEDAVREHAIPTRKGKSVRIYYMTQASVKPTTFLLFCNNKELLHWSYVRYLENELRERFGFQGIPLIMETRGRKPEHMES